MNFVNLWIVYHYLSSIKLRILVFILADYSTIKQKFILARIYQILKICINKRITCLFLDDITQIDVCQVLNKHQKMDHREIFESQSEEYQSYGFFSEPSVPKGCLLLRFYDDGKFSDEEKPQQQLPNQKYQNERQRRRKINKSKREEMRTFNNSHKIYHTILRNWFQKYGCKPITEDYSTHFNSRVYFVLMLDLIQKEMDGRKFAQEYRQMAQKVIQKKSKQMKLKFSQDPNSEKGRHLQRVVTQIYYSIKACQAFMNGKILKSLEIVYQRNQPNITIISKFEDALRIFHRETGYRAENMPSDYQL